MAFLAGLLLSYMPEESAFWTLSALMSMRTLYGPDRMACGSRKSDFGSEKNFQPKSCTAS